MQALLREHKVTQVDLARMIGAGQSTVNNWCRGYRHIPDGRARQICDVLGIQKEELETGRRVIPEYLPDVVKVIRCRECRYYVPSSSVCVVYNFHPVVREDYCSYARLRDRKAEAEVAARLGRE